MTFLESIRVALISLLANRLRSVLATLGISIGIAAVSTLISVGQSFRGFVNGQFAGLDTNAITLVGEPDYGQRQAAVAPRLTDDDVEALALLPNVARVVPAYRGSGEVRSGAQFDYADIVGVTPSYLRPDQRLALGRFIVQRDLDERARVAVLEWNLAQQLFPDGRPMGQRINLLGLSFTVIGVLENQPGNLFGSPFRAVVPITTARDRLFPDSALSGVQINQATLYLADPRRLAESERAVINLLRQRHKLLPEQGNDFRIENMRQITETSNNILLGITAFLGVIGGIALLVGGIGIANIMLVSVTERTQEIGLRKAVGARRRDIMVQFLIEAVMLSLLGGLGGLLVTAMLMQLGAIAAQLITKSGELAGALALDFGAVVLALVFASLVGVVAGSYPAFRASRLAPIDALRSN